MAERSEPSVDDRLVPRRMFLGVGVFVALVAVLYWFTAYEDAGTVLLAVAAVLALWCGVYLWLQQRRRATGSGDGEGAQYLPHASACPFAIGLGVAAVANGLVLGIWVIVPGVALIALGIGGFIHQTRHRY